MTVFGVVKLFLKQVRDKKSGRTHLTMARSYRVKGKKYPQAVTVESFGWLDDLKKQYDAGDYEVDGAKVADKMVQRLIIDELV